MARACNVRRRAGQASWRCASLVISNMFTVDLPLNSSFSVASALIMRGLLLDWSLFFLMYFHSLLIMSVRVMGESPTTAASLALGVSGFQNADFGFLRFMCLPPWTGREMCRR